MDQRVLPVESADPAILQDEVGDAEIAVADGQWRVVWSEDQPPQLFDVRADPAEETDLAALHPERVTRMMDTWRASVADAAAAATGAGPDMTSEGDTSALRFLGYVDDEAPEEE